MKTIVIALLSAVALSLAFVLGALTLGSAQSAPQVPASKCGFYFELVGNRVNEFTVINGVKMPVASIDSNNASDLSAPSC